MSNINFKEFDLRNQIPSLEGKWYYEYYKDRLRIYKHTVVFNEYFHFKVKYFFRC